MLCPYRSQKLELAGPPRFLIFTDLYGLIQIYWLLFDPYLKDLTKISDQEVINISVLNLYKSVKKNLGGPELVRMGYSNLWYLPCIQGGQIFANP